MIDANKRALFVGRRFILRVLETTSSGKSYFFGNLYQPQLKFSPER